jgi:hypothetical protein
VCGEACDPGTCLGGQLGDAGFSLKDRAGLVGQDAECRRYRALDAQQHFGQHSLHRRRQAQRLGQERRSERAYRTSPWSESLKYGHYLLDDKARLMPEIEEIFRMAHDRDAAIFFGHPTKQEFRAMAEYSQKIGFKKGVVDHPFSPFVSLTIEEMQQAAEAGLWINFTYDELSPLLGIDPGNMYKAIRTVGPAHCTLSSDAGEPLFPNSVESLRLLRGHMAAFGCTPEEIYTMSTLNPSFIVGLNLSTTQRVSAAH